MGWLFGGWPPPPPALDTVTFAEVKAALAMADSSVSFNGQKITNVAPGTAPTDVAVVSQLPPGPLTAPRVVYINPAIGNDANDGLSPATPWLTWAKQVADLQSYTRLLAPYSAHLQGTGSLANNVDMTVPLKGSAGAYDVICDDYTQLAGPFTITVVATGSVTAGVPPSVQVASGLGINTYRAATMRVLTGPAAGFKRLIGNTTDTLLEMAGTLPTGLVAGATFDIVYASVAFTGVATWTDAAVGLGRIPTGQLAINFLVNLRGIFQVFGGTWATWGVYGQIFQAGASTMAGFNIAANARLGCPANISWSTWGIGNPVVAAGTLDTAGVAVAFTSQSSAVIAPSTFIGTIVASIWYSGLTSDGGGGKFQQTLGPTACDIGGFLFGGTNTPTMSIRTPLSHNASALIVAGNAAFPLIDLVDTVFSMTVPLTPRPGALVTTILKTYGNAFFSLKGNCPVAAAVAAGGYGMDCRAGGVVRVQGTFGWSGAAGDNIVDTAVGAVANAFFTTGGIGIFNAQAASLISRI